MKIQTLNKQFWLRITSLCGMLAVSIYVGIIIAGGILYPNYSHLSQDISELVASHATTRELLNPFFLLYNILLGIFTFGIFLKWNLGVTKAVAVCLFVTVLASIAMWWFPMDSKGYLATTTGAIHIVLAGVESLTTVLATLLFGFGTKKVSKQISNLSFSFCAAIVITGVTATILTAANYPFSGLFERFTIGAFLLWVFLISFLLPTRTSTIELD